MKTLFKDHYPVPALYYSNDNQLEMEYIQGLDIVEYLQTRSVNKLDL